jgi:SAM-dependent methyltransferase
LPKVAINDSSLMSEAQIETVACNLCGSVRHKILFTTRDFRLLVDDQSFNVVRCRDCGLVFVNPRPTEIDIHRYYTDEFYNTNETADQGLAEYAWRYEAMSRQLLRYPTGRLLDLGCYRGEFLHFMKLKGWDVAGVEFSTRPPNLFGLDIHYGDLADARFGEASFDVITIWAVLEHVYDPSQTLQHVHRLLKPGGSAVILVPNFNSLPARFMHHDDVPRHVTMFTRRTLGSMLKKNHFQPTEWLCSQDIYSGSVRGWLNFLVKRLYGESTEQILAQNRRSDRWFEFSRCINGRERRLMEWIDTWDIRLAPHLDRIMDRLHRGFIMVVHAEKLAI